MTIAKQNRGIFLIVLLLIAGLLVYGFLTMPDRRGIGQKFDDAVEELPNGPDKAIRQLEDRTPGEKLGDKIEDFGEDVKEKTDR